MCAEKKRKKKCAGKLIPSPAGAPAFGEKTENKAQNLKIDVAFLYNFFNLSRYNLEDSSHLLWFSEKLLKFPSFSLKLNWDHIENSICNFRLTIFLR